MVFFCKATAEGTRQKHLQQHHQENDYGFVSPLWMCNANTEFTFPVRFTQTEQEVVTVLYVLKHLNHYE